MVQIGAPAKEVLTEAGLGFEGVRRRFELLGPVGKASVRVDDYAHHPRSGDQRDTGGGAHGARTGRRWSLLCFNPIWWLADKGIRC